MFDTEAHAPYVDDFEARFWARVDKSGPCWLWTGSVSSHGYGQVTRQGKGLGAHRVAYELLVGPIPDGFQLDHVRAHGCTNRHCVKAIADEYGPAHLEPVTPRENAMRGESPRVRIARAGVCEQGHPLERRGAKGGRVSGWCRICHNAKQRERWQPVSYSVVCAECEATFHATRKDKRFCSDRCRFRARDRARIPTPYDPEKRHERYVQTRC